MYYHSTTQGQTGKHTITNQLCHSELMLPLRLRTVEMRLDDGIDITDGAIKI